MKRIIAALATLALLFGLCGCSDVSFPNIQDIFDDKPAGQSGKKIELSYELASIGDKSEPVKSVVPSGEPRVISLTLDEKVIAVEAGEKAQITYSVKPTTAYDQSVYYVSSDESIVRVDKAGYVLGVKPGAVTITVYTNDGGFKRTCTVIVNHNGGDAEQTDALVRLINDARLKNGYAETSAANVSLKAAANQRAYEEAVDMVNYGDTRMDDKRKQEIDGVREEMEITIFEQYNIWSKSSKAVYVWGEYTAEQAFKAFIEDDECAAALGVRGQGEESYDYIAAGYFEFDGITYWSILMTSQ